MTEEGVADAAGVLLVATSGALQDAVQVRGHAGGRFLVDANNSLPTEALVEEPTDECLMAFSQPVGESLQPPYVYHFWWTPEGGKQAHFRAGVKVNIRGGKRRGRASLNDAKNQT